MRKRACAHGQWWRQGQQAIRVRGRKTGSASQSRGRVVGAQGGRGEAGNGAACANKGVARWMKGPASGPLSARRRGRFRLGFGF